jgi:cytochrome P450
VINAHTVGHFLDEIYPDAFSFNPGRFVENGRFAPRANGFFGGGVHICLGRNLTLMQTPVALAQMLKYHDVDYIDEAALRPIFRTPGRQIPPEIWATFKPRAP